MLDSSWTALISIQPSKSIIFLYDRNDNNNSDKTTNQQYFSRAHNQTNLTITTENDQKAMTSEYLKVSRPNRVGSTVSRQFNVSTTTTTTTIAKRNRLTFDLYASASRRCCCLVYIFFSFPSVRSVHCRVCS